MGQNGRLRDLSLSYLNVEPIEENVSQLELQSFVGTLKDVTSLSEISVQALAHLWVMCALTREEQTGGWGRVRGRARLGIGTTL